MRKLAFGVLFAGLVVACGGGGHGTVDIMLVDTSVDGGGTCNVLTQTGCSAGQKCTWFIDQDGTNGNPDIGHIGCAADGTVALGAACMYGAGGSNATGDDNCETGDVCISGICKQICSQTGSPSCDSMHACQVYYGFLGPPNMEAGGVCDPVCDPLTDNNFLDGSNATMKKTGTICADTEGCYPSFGGGSAGSADRTAWTCAPAPNTTLVHRSTCDAASGCAVPDGSAAYKNGCAQGYIPYIKDDQAGVNSFVCIAICKPADCFMGGCGTANVQQIGSTAAPTQRCNATDARGAFSTTDFCQYSWVNEIDSNTGDVVMSTTSDTVGLCIDSSTRHFTDVNGDTTGQPAWPKCDTLPATMAGTDGCLGTTATMAMCSAVDFGCVSTTTGGITEEFGKKFHSAFGLQLRHPYLNVARQPRD